MCWCIVFFTVLCFGISVWYLLSVGCTGSYKLRCRRNGSHEKNISKLDPICGFLLLRRWCIGTVNKEYAMLHKVSRSDLNKTSIFNRNCYVFYNHYLVVEANSPHRSELGLAWTTVFELLLSNSRRQPENQTENRFIRVTHLIHTDRSSKTRKTFKWLAWEHTGKEITVFWLTWKFQWWNTNLKRRTTSYLCPLSEGLCCDWMSLMKGVGLISLQEGAGEGQIHLSSVHVVYLFFCLATNGDKTKWCGWYEGKMWNLRQWCDVFKLCFIQSTVQWLFLKCCHKNAVKNRLLNLNYWMILSSRKCPGPRKVWWEFVWSRALWITDKPNTCGSEVAAGPYFQLL